jgi:SSS family solute:Na+ symporter
VIVSLFTKPKPDHEIEGLVWGLKRPEQESDSVVGDQAWYRSPILLGVGALVIVVVLNVIFI